MQMMKVTGITGGHPILINPSQVCWAESVQSPLEGKKQCVNVFTAESDTELKVDCTLEEFQTKFRLATENSEEQIRLMAKHLQAYNRANKS